MPGFVLYMQYLVILPVTVEGKLFCYIHLTDENTEDWLGEWLA